MAGKFFFENWAEIWFFILLIIGFIVSLFVPSAFLTYVVIFFAGMMAGRLIYEREGKMSFPYYLILIGFLIGYLLGSLYANKMVVLALFIIGGILSFQLHAKKVIRDFSF